MTELLYEHFQLEFDYLITAREILDKYHSIWEPTADFPNEQYIKKYVISLMTLYAPEEFKDLE